MVRKAVAGAPCGFLMAAGAAAAANPSYAPLPPGFSGPTVQVRPPDGSSVGAPSTDGIGGFDVPGGSLAYGIVSPRASFGVAPSDATASAAPAAGFACALRAYNPYSAGGYHIGATAANQCTSGNVTYQDLGSCLQVIQPGGEYGDTKCTSTHKYGLGYISTFMESPCSGTFNWRTRANAHAIVNGVLYASPQVYSPGHPLLRCT